MNKIERLIGNEWHPFGYGDLYARETVRGIDRLVIGLNDRHAACVSRRVLELLGPYQLLYVLHTTRTGANLGRYESPTLQAADVDEFLARFGRFLSEDARQDFWIRSYEDEATIVLDRHNLIYAYGPLELFEPALRDLGVQLGERPQIPAPHTHLYHQEWDHAEREILDAFSWRVTPLRESDVQSSD